LISGILSTKVPTEQKERVSKQKERRGRKEKENEKEERRKKKEERKRKEERKERTVPRSFTGTQTKKVKEVSISGENMTIRKPARRKKLMKKRKKERRERERERRRAPTNDRSLIGCRSSKFIDRMT
jgi:hypothetical protein